MVAEKGSVDNRMNRAELGEYIAEAYGAAPEFLWRKYPTYAVFRHSGNQKWFAVVMEAPKRKLGLQGGGTLPVANFKCDPILAGSLRLEAGFFPAYHMNKDCWITAALDGSAPDETIKMLLDLSFEATAPKAHRRKKGGV